jgi:hypothetical protein
MCPCHPNDVAKQAVMNRVHGGVANSITVDSSVKMSEIESSRWFDTSTIVRRSLQSDDFSFPR